MDPRIRPAAPRRYEIFDPKSDSVEEQGAVTFLVYLPEFRKEELRIQLSSSRLLKISGERPLGDNKWKRFVKEIRVPEECDAEGIVAKFDRGLLYVKQPKLVAPKTDPINIPEKMEEEKELRQESKNVVESAEDKGVKEDIRMCFDDYGMENVDPEIDDLRNKNEQEIRPHKRGLFEKIKINLRKLCFILVLLVTLVLRIISAGRVL